MTYLLDTSVWLNRAMIPAVIPGPLLARLSREKSLGLCDVSFLEAALLHRKGRLGTLTVPFIELLRKATGQDIEPLDLLLEVAALTLELPPDFRGDPFDRVIAATARHHRLKLVTNDARIRDSGFCDVEFFHFKPARLKN